MKINQKGFTLIELLVVIAIIGLLASVVLVSLNSARQKSRNAKRLSDINQMAKALELFYNDAASYPTGTGAAGAATNYVCATVGCGGNLMGSAQMTSVLGSQTKTFTPTYVTGIPVAPDPQDGSCAASGYQSNDYYYETNVAGTTYTITFCLGQVTGNFQPGVRILTPAGVR